MLTPIPLAFGTGNGAAFNGELFDAAALPVNGAIQDDWATLPADPTPACALINGLTAGCGGVWLSNSIATPAVASGPGSCGYSPPATPAPPATKTKKCKKGFKKKKVKGKVKCVKKKKKKKKK